jgi:hypothetical protein
MKRFIQVDYWPVLNKVGSVYNYQPNLGIILLDTYIPVSNSVKNKHLSCKAKNNLFKIVSKNKVKRIR